MRHWESGLIRLPVTQENAGSNPAWRAIYLSVMSIGRRPDLESGGWGIVALD